jgi:hypothetical protein
MTLETGEQFHLLSAAVAALGRRDAVQADQPATKRGVAFIAGQALARRDSLGLRHGAIAVLEGAASAVIGVHRLEAARRVLASTARHAQHRDHQPQFGHPVSLPQVRL